MSYTLLFNSNCLQKTKIRQAVCRVHMYLEKERRKPTKIHDFQYGANLLSGVHSFERVGCIGGQVWELELVQLAMPF